MLNILNKWLFYKITLLFEIYKLLENNKLRTLKLKKIQLKQLNIRIVFQFISHSEPDYLLFSTQVEINVFRSNRA